MTWGDIAAEHEIILSSSSATFSAPRLTAISPFGSVRSGRFVF
jgi:hypothetical protein